MEILNADVNVLSGPDRMLAERHLKIVRLVMPKGKVIKRHRSLMTVAVVAIKGSVKFFTDDQEVVLVPGKVAVMRPGEEHWLEATEQGGELVVVHGVLAQ
jgi:quercetin dioxygenase-like cupin family protein